MVVLRVEDHEKLVARTRAKPTAILPGWTRTGLYWVTLCTQGPARPIAEAAAKSQLEKRARQSGEDRASLHRAAGVARASPMTSVVYISPRRRKRRSGRLAEP